jgi:hypothetical protein
MYDKDLGEAVEKEAVHHQLHIMVKALDLLVEAEVEVVLLKIQQVRLLSAEDLEDNLLNLLLLVAQEEVEPLILLLVSLQFQDQVVEPVVNKHHNFFLF